MNSTISSIHKQSSMVAEVAKKVPPYSGSFFSKAFILPRMASWQAHLQRISSYLQYGEGVWWKALDDGYQFLDSDVDVPTNACGPTLCHFRDKCIQDVWDLSRAAWKSIVDSKTTLPSPYIRLFKNDINW